MLFDEAGGALFPNALKGQPGLRNSPDAGRQGHALIIALGEKGAQQHARIDWRPTPACRCALGLRSSELTNATSSRALPPSFP